MKDKLTPEQIEPIQLPPYDPYSIVFDIMVFQGMPKYNKIYFWLDGSASKQSMKQDVFIKLVRMSNENLVHDAYEASITYSFYLWNKVENRISHLMMRATDLQYSDSINNIIQGKVQPKKKGVQERRTLEEVLVGYGFNVPTNKTVQDLQVSMIPNAPTKDDRFSLIRSLLSGRRK